jgi:hypothetical protein
MSDPLFPGQGGTGRAPRSMGLFGRIVAALATIGALIVGFMFSLVVFAGALVLGIAVWAWLWWKMRRVLKQARLDPRFAQFQARAGGMPPAKGDVIEGEVIREEWKDRQP